MNRQRSCKSVLKNESQSGSDTFDTCEEDTSCDEYDSISENDLESCTSRSCNIDLQENKIDYESGILTPFIHIPKSTWKSHHSSSVNKERGVHSKIDFCSRKMLQEKTFINTKMKNCPK